MKSEIKKLIDDGFLTYKENADNTLYLLNYTDKCTYEKKWIGETINNRGSVYRADNDEQVAHPFVKFFNFSELLIEEQIRISNLSNMIDTVTEKIDGSLGILYYWNGNWLMNTRGSFSSEQAKKGKEIFDKYYSNNPIFQKNYYKLFTFLFEIIYPEDKKIIDYDGDEDLYLLSIFDEKGIELKLEEVQSIAEIINCKFPFQYTQFKTFDQIIKWQKSLDHTKEGCVVKLKDGSRYKFKSPKYLELAKLLNDINPKQIWNMMENGKVKINMLKSIPEEYRAEIDKIISTLENDYSELQSLIITAYLNILTRYQQLSVEEICKIIGKDLSISPIHKKILFPLIRNQQAKVDEMIWKSIEPK